MYVLIDSLDGFKTRVLIYAYSCTQGNRQLCSAACISNIILHNNCEFSQIRFMLFIYLVFNWHGGMWQTV